MNYEHKKMQTQWGRAHLQVLISKVLLLYNTYSVSVNIKNSISIRNKLFNGS